MWNCKSDQIIANIYFIRHGATEGNLEKRYIGRTDQPLCKEGKLWLQEKKKEKAYPDCQKIYASPMLRCRETAEIIYPGIPVQVVEDLKETNFGDFEGKNYEELKDDSRYQAWIDSNGALPFPNGESFEEARLRAVSAFEEILFDIQKEGLSDVALVLHGGSMMAILSAFGGGNYYDYQVKNGEGYASKYQMSKKGHKLRQLRRLS